MFFPSRIRLRKVGTTLARLPRTFPNRTQQNRVFAVAGRLCPDQHLGNALGSTHDACRIHCLVCRNHDEGFDLELACKLSEVSGTNDVVQDRLGGVGLHDRHVFVSGGMENDLGMGVVENAGQAVLVSDISNHLAASARQDVSHLQPEFEKRILVLVEHDELLRVKEAELANQLRPDRAGRAGDEHPLAVVRLSQPDIAHRGDDLGPPEQILHFDLPKPADGDPTLSDFRETGYRRNLDPVALEPRDDLAHMRRRRRGNCEDYFLDPMLADQLEDLVGCAQNGYAVDDPVPLALVVVNITDDLELRPTLEVANQELSRLSGPDQQGPLLLAEDVLRAIAVPVVRALNRSLPLHVATELNTPQDADGHQASVSHYRERCKNAEGYPQQCVVGEHEEPGYVKCDRGGSHAVRDLDRFFQPGISPHQAVHTHQQVEEDIERDHIRRQGNKLSLLFKWRNSFETQDVGGDEAAGNEDDIDGKLDRPECSLTRIFSLSRYFCMRADSTTLPPPNFGLYFIRCTHAVKQISCRKRQGLLVKRLLVACFLVTW